MVSACFRRAFIDRETGAAHLHGRCLRDSQGPPTRLVGSVIDSTEREQASYDVTAF